LKTFRQLDQVSGGPDVGADGGVQRGIAVVGSGRRQVYDDVYFEFDSVHVGLVHAQVRLRKIAPNRLHLTAVRGIFDFHAVEKLYKNTARKTRVIHPTQLTQYTFSSKMPTLNLSNLGFTNRRGWTS